MAEQSVNAGLTIPHLGPSFVVDPVNRKVHVKSQVSADAGNKIIAGSDGGAFVADTPVWLKQTDGTPATADTDAIQHTGNVALKQNVAYRTKVLPTVAQLDATDASNILLTTSGTIEGITGGEDGKQLVLTNTSTGEVTLSNDSLTATAGTKIKIGDSFSFVMAPNASVLLNYDPINACWRSVSQTVLGFAPSWAQFAANAVQGLNAPSNITFNAITASSGTDISIAGGGVRLKAGRKYRLRGFVPWSNPTGYMTYQWYDGANLIGQSGHNESATSGISVGGGGAAEAIVTPTVDTTYWMRATSAGGIIYTTAGRFPNAWVECLEGLAPASNIKLLSRVFFGSQLDPNTVSPAGDAIEGETFFQTLDGTKTGDKLAVWKYDGTTWHRMSQFSLQGTTTAGDGIRSYYPSVVALQSKWTAALTAANITAFGFTAAGGATIADYGSTYGSPLQRMLRITATRPTTTTAANTLWTIPTSYIRHEIAVKPTTANHYMLQVLTGGAARQVAAEVWLCNPTTGVPEKRLYGQTANETGDTNAADCGSLSKAPDNSAAYEDMFRQWVGFEIPLSAISAYKTASNTVKLAIRPSGDNGETNFFYICGYAMLESAYSMIHTPALVYENTVNIPGLRNNATGGNQAVWFQDLGGYGNCYVPVNQTRIFDIPLPDASKDIYLTVLSMWRDGTDTDGHGTQYALFDIIHTSGDVSLGRPRPDIVAPISRQPRWGHKPMGFVIPAAVLAAKGTMLNANAAIPFLRIRVTAINSGLNATLGALITEQV